MLRQVNVGNPIAAKDRVNPRNNCVYLITHRSGDSDEFILKTNVKQKKTNVGEGIMFFIVI